MDFTIKHRGFPVNFPIIQFYDNIDPENSLVLMETNLPTPKNARVYVNLPDGN